MLIMTEELTESRDPDQLRIPEFSQSLTTAIQLLILEVFSTWNSTFIAYTFTNLDNVLVANLPRSTPTM